MPWLVPQSTEALLIFSLVLARLSGLALLAPIYGSREIPARIRGLLVFSLALIITPVQLKSSAALPQTLVELAIAASGELLVGLALGLGLAILLGSAQLAGQIVGQMSGVALAEIYDPLSQEQVSVFSQFFHLVALAAYLTIGGHQMAVEGLLESFAVLPPGSARFSESLAAVLSSLVSQSFVLAVRGAAPAMCALLVTTVLMGLVARTLPQLNILSVGFNVSACVSLLILVGAMSGVVWIVIDHVTPSLHLVLDAIAECGRISY